MLSYSCPVIYIATISAAYTKLNETNQKFHKYMQTKASIHASGHFAYSVNLFCRLFEIFQRIPSDPAIKVQSSQTVGVAKSTESTTPPSTTTTTERYRISRKELGYILGRNYRGLKKLFRIELNDALNVR